MQAHLATKFINGCMEAGYDNFLEATNPKWRVPVLDWMHKFPAPELMYAKPLGDVMPRIDSLPKNPFFVPDGSSMMVEVEVP